MDNIQEIKNGITGIYLLRNLINGKIYVGKSVNVRKRMYQHSKPEIYHKHTKESPIVRAIKKYGFENFSIEILETFTGRLYLIREGLSMISSQNHKKKENA